MTRVGADYIFKNQIWNEEIGKIWSQPKAEYTYVPASILSLSALTLALLLVLELLDAWPEREAEIPFGFAFVLLDVPGPDEGEFVRVPASVLLLALPPSLESLHFFLECLGGSRVAKSSLRDSDNWKKIKIRYQSVNF